MSGGVLGRAIVNPFYFSCLRHLFAALSYALKGIKNLMAETSIFLQVVTFLTQILDGIGASIFGTMYILVTSDVSASTRCLSPTLELKSNSRDNNDLRELMQNKAERILL
jgi:hypothetical protein